MVSAGYQLGSRVFSSLRVWAAAVLLTFAFCEGAGFGAFSYQCVRYDPYSAPGQQCTLIAQTLLPPGTPWTTFGWNAATLWLAGFLDGGFLIGLLLSAAAFAIGSRMSSVAVTRAFSLVPVATAFVLICVLGYDCELQATIVAGLPQVRP